MFKVWLKPLAAFSILCHGVFDCGVRRSMADVALEAVVPPVAPVGPPNEPVDAPGEAARPAVERDARSRSRSRQRLQHATRKAGAICTGTAMLARLVESTDLMCENVRRECAVTLRPHLPNLIGRVEECEQAVRVLADHVKAVAACADAMTGSF